MERGSRGNTFTQQHINVLIPAAFEIVAAGTTKIVRFLARYTLKFSSNTSSETESTDTWYIHIAKVTASVLAKSMSLPAPKLRMVKRKLGNFYYVRE